MTSETPTPTMTREEFINKVKALPGAAVLEADFKTRGFDLDVTVAPQTIVEAVQLMDQAGYFLDTMTGVDWLGEPPLPEDELEVVYDFNRFDERHGVVLRVRTPRSKPEIPTIQHIYPIAHWHEREAHEFFGIVFTGHPYLIPLLLPEDADYHPLLKDFEA